MSRARLFLRGVISGYASISVNILFSLLSVPVALHYLGKEDFGLWVLIVQLAGYLALLDLGMSVSIARFLADYKDDINGGRYGSVLKTGQVVFVVQGALIALFGAVAVFWAPCVLRIPPELITTFSILMAAQTLLAAASFATRMVNSPLWCHQRYDINNLAASTSLIANFGFMWLGFHLQFGLYAMLLGAAVGFVVGLLIPLGACLKLGLYPRKGCWGNFEMRLFHEIFRFGRDIFLMSLGTQLTSASQVILVTRLMGLEAASVWSVSTKTYAMGQQFVGRVFDSSAGGLTEMLVRNEDVRVRCRFEELISLTAMISGIGTVGLLLFNAPFVSLWTQGKIHWDLSNNLLLGLLLLSTTVIRCHTGLVGITKDIKGMKFIYLAEGVVFLLLGYALARIWGFAGILLSSIICNILITGIYAFRRTGALFQSSFKTVAAPLIRPLFSTLLLGLLSFSALPLLGVASNWFDLVLRVSLWLLFAGILGWFVGLSLTLKTQIRNHLPGRRNRAS